MASVMELLLQGLTTGLLLERRERHLMNPISPPRAVHRCHLRRHHQSQRSGRIATRRPRRPQRKRIWRQLSPAERSSAPRVAKANPGERNTARKEEVLPVASQRQQQEEEEEEQQQEEEEEEEEEQQREEEEEEQQQQQQEEDKQTGLG